jgi:hypothetical protein
MQKGPKLSLGNIPMNTYIFTCKLMPRVYKQVNMKKEEHLQCNFGEKLIECRNLCVRYGKDSTRSVDPDPDQIFS